MSLLLSKFVVHRFLSEVTYLQKAFSGILTSCLWRSGFIIAIPSFVKVIFQRISLFLNTDQTKFSAAPAMSYGLRVFPDAVCSIPEIVQVFPVTGKIIPVHFLLFKRSEPVIPAGIPVIAGINPGVAAVEHTVSDIDRVLPETVRTISGVVRMISGVVPMIPEAFRRITVMIHPIPPDNRLSSEPHHVVFTKMYILTY